jgi:hypothetical protein
MGRVKTALRTVQAGIKSKGGPEGPPSPAPLGRSTRYF